MGMPKYVTLQSILSALQITDLTEKESRSHNLHGQHEQRVSQACMSQAHRLLFFYLSKMEEDGEKCSAGVPCQGLGRW